MREDRAMFRPTRLILLGLLLPALAAAQEPRRVTVESFARAETDSYFAGMAAQGEFGRVVHTREPTRVEAQTVIRMNRDTLYSTALVDLDAGPVTVTLPDTGGRFLSVQAVDQDHYVPEVLHAPARRSFTRAEVGTRYMALLFRTFADPNDPADLASARAAQDGIRLEHGGGRYEPSAWDKASLDAVRDALNTLAGYRETVGRSFGRRGEVDPVQHLISTAAGWGGNPPQAATYISIYPPDPAGSAAWRMRLADVPVDGFWSVTVYDARGFMAPNPRNAYSVNNIRRGAGGHRSSNACPEGAARLAGYRGRSMRRGAPCQRAASRGRLRFTMSATVFLLSPSSRPIRR
jgi:hypothetical protein